MENLKNYCPKHNVALISCSYEGCDSKPSEICKFCALNSKEQLNHLAIHFEHMKELSLADSESDESILSKSFKNDQEYSEINKIFQEIYDKAKYTINSTFDQVLNKRVIMTEQVRNTIIIKYEIFTKELEDLVKNLSEKLSSVTSFSNKLKEEISKLKKELDAKLTLLGNPQEISKDLEVLIFKIENIIKKLKIEDVLNNKFNLDILRKSPVSLELTTGGNRIVVTPRGSSYWATKSEEILDGPFFCKIRVVSINSNNTGSYWNYAVGIIRANSTNESSYYNDSILLQSNGYIPEKFTGSGSTRQIILNNWKNNDVIMIKRDEINSVYFAHNDENTFHLAFTDISGPFRIVMGFGTSMNGDIFELEELSK